MEFKTRLQVENLDTAEQALRENLHVHLIDETARTHMNRALAHVREALIATKQIGQARSVEELVHDLNGFQEILKSSKIKSAATMVCTHKV